MLARALIVLLLVLNLGVAAWWSARPEQAPAPLPAQPAGVPRLQLSSEAPHRAAAPVRATPAPAPAPVAQAPVDATTDATGARRCYALGPFDDASTARAALQPRVQALRVREERVPATSGAWNVAMPPSADRAAAQALAARIVAAGFTDYYVINTGAAANGIALGRFGSEEAARRHQQALRAAGFDAQLQAPQPRVRQWLDIAVPATFDLQGARTASGASQAQPVECGTLR